MVPPGIIALLKRKRAQEVVHVPKIIPRIYKQVVEEPIPKTLEEIVQVPKIIQQSHIQQQVEIIGTKNVVEVKMKKEKKEKKKKEKMTDRIRGLEDRLEGLLDAANFVDTLFEKEEIVHVPTIVNHHCHNHEQVEQIVHESKIIQEPKFIQQTELGRVLPFSPKARDLHMQVFFQVLPSARYAWITP